MVLGKPLNQASGGEGINLQEKATVKGAGLLAKQIGARFGLEDVSVEETETGASVLSIGKYLSPRLYISYGMGILEPVTVVQLQYELSDIWTLEATSGTETRAGIQFDYEP